MRFRASEVAGQQDIRQYIRDRGRSHPAITGCIRVGNRLPALTSALL